MNIALDLYRARRRRIERRLRKTQDKFEASRCRILLLLHARHSVVDVAERVGCARATVYRTVYRFEDLGEAGLSDRRFQPEARKVTPELMNYLLSLLDVSPRSLGWQRSTWTLELMALQVEERMQVKLSASHIRNILLWLGCRRGRPRPGLRIPFRGRRKILEAIQRVVACASEREEVFYLDEADIDLNPRIGPCYMKKGRQWVVLTPGKNEKRYVAGALNARTGRVIHTFPGPNAPAYSYRCWRKCRLRIGAQKNSTSFWTTASSTNRRERKHGCVNTANTSCFIFSRPTRRSIM